MFERVFPALVAGAGRQPADDDLAGRCARPRLIFLYRLLFVLYAEDRGLLPVNDTAVRGLRPAQSRCASTSTRRMDARRHVFSDNVAQ